MTPIKYNLLIIFRVLLIALMLFVFLFSLRQQAWYMTATVSGVLVPVLLAELIWFLHRKDRELARFLMAIRQKDFTGYGFTPENTKDSRLHEAFREIIREFNTISIEKEMHYQYLQAIVEHVRIALISMDADGRVEFFNREAANLLGIKLLRNVDDLITVDPELPSQIRSLRPGKAKLMRLNRGGEMLHLSLSSNVIRLRDRELVLLTLQDIRNALDEQELESWKKLIKILRHEIMNSVTPVTSLSAAMNRMLQQDVEERNDGGFLPAGELEDLRNSMQTIEKRSKGLLKFVDTYRTLTKIPKPVFRESSVKEVVDHVLVLLGTELEGISIMADHKNKDLSIQADPDLLG
ncbi:MAG: PAS domain-containing protein, partial [Bacteroidetes bacterium]|nr:PAS domain-containing protein [Bacteroidota bacterium]